LAYGTPRFLVLGLIAGFVNEKLNPEDIEECITVEGQEAF
jgi:hypothetical protein